jgi:hypothetical protein
MISTTTTAAVEAGVGWADERAPLTLETLVAMTPEALHETYRAGGIPDSMKALDGCHDGRMLALPGAAGHGAIADGLRRLAAWERFPWRGKSFRAADDERGGGSDRVHLLRTTHDLFPFETRIEDSIVDGRPCILLDYDLVESPMPLRHLRDELREVAPGLFLGVAFVHLRRPTLAVYFAIVVR